MPLIVEPRDWIYRRSRKNGEAAPIVVEQYKLVFFVVPQVAEIHFKRLLLRMLGQEDWKTRKYRRIQHEAFNEGLKYLSDYSLEAASEMMTSNEWTRAMFIRDPKERFVQAYTKSAVMDRALLHGICCMTMPRMFCLRDTRTSAKLDAPNATAFLEGIHICKSTHWDPVTERLSALMRLGLTPAQKAGFDKNYYLSNKYWRYINFIGSMDDAARDAKALLERVGAWEQAGESGWGDDGSESFFQSKDFIKEELMVMQKLSEIIVDPDMEREVEDFYQSDYKHFNLTKKYVFSISGKTYIGKTKELQEMLKSVAVHREW